MTADRFYQAYEGKPPWDIDRAQPAIVELADGGEIEGPVLDVGCGTGENALFLASRGFEVAGVDAVPAAIRGAARKAQERGLSAAFLVLDALELEGLGRRFRTVVDSGLFHTFDAERLRFALSLASVLEPGGSYFVLCFSERERRAGGPRRVTRGEIRAVFGKPLYRVLWIRAAGMATRLDGGPRKAWLAAIERLPEQGVAGRGKAATR